MRIKMAYKSVQVDGALVTNKPFHFICNLVDVLHCNGLYRISAVSIDYCILRGFSDHSCGPFKHDKYGGYGSIQSNKRIDEKEKIDGTVSFDGGFG